MTVFLPRPHLLPIFIGKSRAAAIPPKIAQAMMTSYWDNLTLLTGNYSTPVNRLRLLAIDYRTLEKNCRTLNKKLWDVCQETVAKMTLDRIVSANIKPHQNTYLRGAGVYDSPGRRPRNYYVA